MSLFSSMAAGRRAVFAAAILVACASAGASVSQPQRLEIKVLSSRPDMISGGDALVEVALPGGTAAGQVQVTLNGADVTSQLKATPAGLRGVISGMTLGKNKLEAKRTGGGRASLAVVNHPQAGPIVAGPHLTPYECRTVESGLGAPLDANCSANQKIEYFYASKNANGATAFKPLPNPTGPRPADLITTRTLAGVTVPYIVRVDSGVIDRSIYRIAVLDEPKAGASGAWTPGAAWNGRLAVTFGGGAGSQYNQGVNQANAALSDLYLSRGFAYVASTELVNQQHANAVLQGENLMMIKEYFIERYGVPKWTVGTGGSGGAIQQLVITQMYPGLLDGIQPSLTFPDSSLFVSDCGLLQHYFKTEASAKTWSEAKHAAVEGFSKNTCASWEASFVPVQDATNMRNCSVNDLSKFYDPVKNPKGARCTGSEMVVNITGRDRKTGFARKAEDNVGLQYGLKGLNDGRLTVDEFLDINEKIGGNDNDGHWRPERSVGDVAAIRATYASGLMNSGGGGLATVPIIHSRGYSDNRADIHSRERDINVRARLQRANGRTDNQVIWVGAAAAGGPNISVLSLDAITKWLDAMAADPAPLTPDKVVRNKPAEAVDAYWDATGKKVAEPVSWDPNTGYNKTYPLHFEPRLQAGAPDTNDVLKCRLKPVRWTDYKVTFTPEQQARMKKIFKGGVCDFSKPGVGQVPLKGVYQKY